MKKVMIAFIGLLLLASYGCSNEGTNESADKTKESVIEAKNKDVKISNDAVKSPKKKPVIEGC